jgi:transcriptional regulator with XRE-family HTH domain
MKIGKVIKRLMIEQGMNQVEFARRLKVTPQRVMVIVNDKTHPSLTTLEKVAKCLDTKVSDLIKLAEKEN